MVYQVFEIAVRVIQYAIFSVDVVYTRCKAF